MKTFSIYALKEPDTGEIRYFGKSDSPKRRFSSHLSCKSETHVAHWIRAMVLRGDAPVMEVLITGLTNDEGIEEETDLIAWGRNKGLRLTNLTDGGEGTVGYRVSDSLREKQSIRMLGNKRGIGSPGFSGHKHSPEEKAKQSAAQSGGKRSAEQNKRRSIAMRGVKRALGCRHSDEQNERKSARMVGNKLSVGKHIGNKYALGTKRTAEQNERNSARQIAVWKKRKEALASARVNSQLT